MTMSVSRALIAIKHFGANIQQRIAENTYAFVVNNNVDILTGKPVEVARKESRAGLQSIRDSIEDAFDKKCKINAANNQTQVKVAGRTMSITEALIYRQHALPHLRTLLAELTKQQGSAARLYQSENVKWSKLAEGKDQSTISTLSATFEPTLHSVEDQIKELQEVIRYFDEELDSVLTETNPTLMIG